MRRMLNKVRVLIVGGTGRLSKDVALCASEHNMEVYCLNRGTEDRKLFVNNSCKMLYADIRDSEGCKAVIGNKKFDAVIDFISYNVEHLEHKLRLLHNSYKQYIFISSATVYAPGSSVYREEDSYITNTGWQYSKDKILCEKYLKEYFQCHKEISFTIVRPYVTYGNTRIPYPIVPFDNQKEWSLIHRIICGQGIPVLKMDNVVTLTHSKDFARGLIGLVANSGAYNEDFHITSQETYKWEDVIDLSAQAAGKPANKKYISLENFLKQMPEYTELLTFDKARDWYFDNTKLISVVPEFKCKIDLREGIEDMINYYMNHLELQRRDLEWDKKIDLLCEDIGV